MSFIAKVEAVLFYLFILFLPTQLGKHFWPDFSIVTGIRVDYLSPTFYFTDVLVGLLFAAWVIKEFQISNQKKKIGNWILDIRYWIFFLLLFLIVNIIFSHNLWNGYYHLFKFFELAFVAFYVTTFLKTKEQFRMIVTMFSIGVIGEALLAFFQYSHQGSIGGILYFLGERTFVGQTPGIANAAINGQLVLRPYGTFSHPNVLAGYFVIALTMIVFSFSSSTAIWRKVLFFLSFTLGTLALLLTFSRVAIVLWVLFFIISFASRLKKQEYRAFFLSAMIVAIFLSSIFLTPLFYRFTQTTTSEEAFTHRELLTSAAAQMIANKPIIGVGLGNFLPTLATIQQPLSASTYFQPVHNIFLLVAAETGIIGFAFFMFFIFKTYERLRQNSYAKVCGFMLSAILILGFFDHYFLTLQQGQLLFALVIGLCWNRIRQ